MCDTERDTEGETKREQCCKVKLSFFLNNACGHASIPEKKKKNLWRRPTQIHFLPLNMFLPAEGFLVFMTALSLYFLLPSHPCLYLMSSTTQPLDTVCFEREMRGNDSFIRQGPGYKSQLTRWSVGWYCRSSPGAGVGLRLLGLSVEHGERVIISPVVTLRDSKHKLASPRKRCAHRTT